MPTLSQFIDQQYLPYVKTYRRSWDTDVSLLKNHLLPRFSKRHLDTITRQDIVQMHANRKASGAAAGSANRLLIMMRFIFNLVLRWEVPWVKANPCASVSLLEVNNKKERYLSQEEAKRLYRSSTSSVTPRSKRRSATLASRKTRCWPRQIPPHGRLMGTCCPQWRHRDSRLERVRYDQLSIDNLRNIREDQVCEKEKAST